MKLGLTTRWNANRHSDGEAMVEEILALGFRQVELGYDLLVTLVPGVRKMVDEKAVTVGSIHSFCPVMPGFTHPETFLLASLDSGEQEMAAAKIIKTVQFAAEVGAKCVNFHAGYVSMKRYTPDLIELYEKGDQYGDKFGKVKLKLLDGREKGVRKHLDALYRGLDAVHPALESTGVLLAMENLPTWESIPTEAEAEEIVRGGRWPMVRCWHDIGHGQVRENLGFIGHRRWLQRLAPYVAGMHIHDVIPPAADHLMPSMGKINWASFKGIVGEDAVHVLEPPPNVPAEAIMAGVETLKLAWGAEL